MYLQLHQILEVIFGRGVPNDKMNAWQMADRAILSYAAALLLLRVFGRRVMGRNSAMDVIVAITFGSTLSRGLTGNSPLFPVLAACGTLVIVDWVLAMLAAHSDKIDLLLKGQSFEILRDGQVQENKMARHTISRRDLQEAARLNGKTQDLQQLQLARVERNGTISIIPQAPRVIEVRVEEGVQTVRIQLHP